MMDEQPPRILGLTIEKVADFRTNSASKSGGVFAALHRRFGVVEVVRPVLPPFDKQINRILHFSPNRARWSSLCHVNAWAFARRTQVAERALQQWQGRYDLIFQLHTLFSPGVDPRRRRYVLHTDNTFMLSERHYPGWVTMRGAQRDAWVGNERMVYQNAQFLFPRSEFLRRSLIDDYGCDPERVIRVGGGANFGNISLEGKRYDQQVALFVGIDFERKGGVALLRAWEQVQRRLPKAQLWIAGPKRPRRLVPGVHWLGMITDRQELARRYREATLFVMPSLFEPWGHVFFEAMGAGLACIGSTCCAMPEIIDDGSTGLLVPPGEHEPLADALIALLDDPQRAEQLGKQAYQQVAQGATWDDVIARMAPYIQQAVAQPVV